MINLTRSPAFVAASKLPIEITLTNSIPAIDHTTYIRIYRVDDFNIKLAGATKVNPVLIQELTKFSKTAAVTYDISNILHSQFTTWATPYAKYIIWLDNSAYYGYYIEYGEVSYSATQQLIYTKRGETNVSWCVRSAADLSEHVVLFNDPVLPLTDNPNYNETNRNQLINFPFLLTIPVGQESGYGCQLYADLTYDDGSVENRKLISSEQIVVGGVYNYTFNASSLVSDPLKFLLLNSFTLAVDWEPVAGGNSGGTTPPVTYSYVGTATRTATCPTGYGGGSVTKTATVTSNTSQADADQRAAIQAQADANAALVCLLVYTSTQSYTASCVFPSYNTTGPVTRSATRTSTISQTDADQLATAAAQAIAQAALQCTIVYQASATYTATCPAGTTGTPTTSNTTSTSTISQADAYNSAYAAAKADAEARLVCTP